MAKKVMGRPEKLTKEVQDKIVEQIRIGQYIEQAAAYAGISKQTLYTWEKRGARAKTAGEWAEEEQKYVDFLDAVEKAMAESEALALGQITKAASDGAWQAAAWRLERKHPERWGRRERRDIRLSGALAHTQVDPESDEEYHKALAEFLGIGGQDAGNEEAEE